MCTASEQGTAGKVPERRRYWGCQRQNTEIIDLETDYCKPTHALGFFPFKMVKITLAETRNRGEITMGGDSKAGSQDNTPVTKHNVLFYFTILA